MDPSTTSSSSGTDDGTDPALPTELRLALVCYGGVSLAVYMHGVTKELFKLVRASRQFDHDRDAGTVKAPGAHAFPDPPVGSTDVEFDTEEIYYAALRELDRQHRPLSVVVDVIAGTSAGGINGVFLGRALAEGRSLNGLRSLWLHNGDLTGLLNGHALPGSARARMIEKMIFATGRLFKTEHHADAPLDGELMSQLLHDALQDMAPVPGLPPLVKPEGSLDLFVPVTDIHGYSTAIPTGVGGVSHTDRSFQQLLSFHHDPRPEPSRASNQFDDASVPALAFAARATSSFPGAFPSVSLGSFAAAVNDKHPGAVGDVAPIAERLVFRGEYGSDPSSAWYMDGGVLDNGPFDHVIQAIARKRASGPVARELLYIEPDPGGPPTTESSELPQPTWLKVIMSSRMTIPWHTSLVDALDQLRDMNASIDEVAALARSEILAVPPQLAAFDLGLGADYATSVAKGPEVRDLAKTLTGLAYSSYCRLRADAVAFEVADALATALGYPLRSNRHQFVVAVVSAWLLRKTEWASISPDVLEQELGPVDTPFRLRRAAFVLQGINEMLADTSLPRGRAAQLERLKSACWDLIERLRQVVDDAITNPAVLDEARAVLGIAAITDEVARSDPQDFAAANTPALNALFNTYRDHVDEVGTSQGVWDTFTAHIAGWDDDAARHLVSRYLLFPIWDAVIFPTVALARLPQLSTIAVRRFSPLDARTLDPAGQPDFGSHKLDGTAIHHFGAFFEERWRENDYLWGRLDGVDLIFDLLGDRNPHVDLTGCRAGAFTAVLDAEQPALVHIPDTIEAIRARVR